MCRAPVTYDVDSLAAAPPPLDLVQADNFTPSAELRCLQQQMAALFLYQKQRGGIIQQDSSVLLLTVSIFYCVCHDMMLNSHTRKNYVNS